MAKTIVDMTIHELRDWKEEVRAELAEVVARIQELERIELGLPAGVEGMPWSSKVQRKPLKEPEPEPEPSQNAQPEGADAA
jgi:hypothetical protein